MSVKTKIKTISWSLLGLCCVVLLVAAMKAKDSKACSNIEIHIDGATKHIFIKKADITEVLKQKGIYAGKTLSDIDLKATETELEKNAWTKDAELFFDNHQTLHVNIAEREPVARVFTASGSSFYIDSSGLRLPVNTNAMARLIVFTSFPSDKKILSKPDSLVLNDVKRIALHLAADSFMNAQTAQINITPQRTYEIIPLVGGQVIKIGNAENLTEKCARLMTFYKQVFSKVGFEKYSVVDVQYKGQVIAVRKGENYVAPSDTARAMRQLKQSDLKLSQVFNDTTYTAPLSKAVKTEAPLQTSVPKAAGKRTVAARRTAQTNKAVKKNNNKKQAVRQKPKAVMKKRS